MNKTGVWACILPLSSRSKGQEMCCRLLSAIDSADMIDKSYSTALVILSLVVATLGAYVAVEIAQRVRVTGGRRRILWNCGGALALGLGIWSMHFVGMLALQLPLLVWYDI